MNRLIFVLLEVQIVADNVITTFIHTMENNLHIEFTPPLLTEQKWHLL